MERARWGPRRSGVGVRLGEGANPLTWRPTRFGVFKPGRGRLRILWARAVSPWRHAGRVGKLAWLIRPRHVCRLNEFFALTPDVFGEECAAARKLTQLADFVPGGIARIPGAGGSMHLVVPPLRNMTSQVRPAGLSSAGSTTNHIVATVSPRTRIMSGTTGLWSLARGSERARPYARPLMPGTAGLAADTYATSAVCSPCQCPVWGTPFESPSAECRPLAGSTQVADGDSFAWRERCSIG